MKKFYYMLLLAVISMTMVSCDEWECEWDTPPYYTHNVFGSWESYCEFDGYDEYHILGSDVESFEFYDNYRGRYYFYSRMGFSFIEFNWTTYNDSRILIWDDYGFYENLYFSFNNYGDLMLSYSGNFNQYTVYRPVGYYYEQGKSFDSLRAKKFDPATDERPKLATKKEKKQ